MALSFFPLKARRPTAASLRSALGPTYPLWISVGQLVMEAAPTATGVWGYGSARAGWGYRWKVRDRVLLYLTPGEGHFLVSTALGERAIDRADLEEVPAAFRQILDAAPRYAEGRGVRLPVRATKDLPLVRALLRLKVVV